MQTPAVQLTLSMDNIIAVLGIIVSVVIAVIGGIYAVANNTKKYELSENYKQEILAWYGQTVEIMMWVIHFYKENKDDKTALFERLAMLSAMVERGRFYFPNVLKGDTYGSKKALAYKGYRHICLEFLVNFYEVSKPGRAMNDNDRERMLWKLERGFTSCIFEMVDPRKRNKKYAKIVDMYLPSAERIVEYLDDY